jgi:SAM-dependent methyltransferase
MGPFPLMKRLIHVFRGEEDVLPYTALAGIYDSVMDHVEYGEWCHYIMDLFEKFGEQVHDVLEGGCGTGILSEYLRQQDYRVFGFDLSSDMVLQANKRIPGFVWQGDIRHIAVSIKWDAFLCLYDTIQYLNLTQIKNLFLEIKKVLKPGGLFIFDIVTEFHVRKYWKRYSERQFGDGWEMWRKSWYDSRRKSLFTEFKVGFENRARILYEQHQQWIYDINVVKALAESCGLIIQAVFSNFSERIASENSERVHFVLKKEDA